MKAFPDLVHSLLALPAMRNMPQLGYLSVLHAMHDVEDWSQLVQPELFRMLLQLPQAKTITAKELHRLLLSYAKGLVRRRYGEGFLRWVVCSFRLVVSHMQQSCCDCLRSCTWHSMTYAFLVELQHRLVSKKQYVVWTSRQKVMPCSYRVLLALYKSYPFISYLEQHSAQTHLCRHHRFGGSCDTEPPQAA